MVILVWLIKSLLTFPKKNKKYITVFFQNKFVHM